MGVQTRLSVRTAAVQSVRSGSRAVDVAGAPSVSPTTVYTWLKADAPELVRRALDCCRCGREPSTPSEPADDAQLLGLYLGDGSISAGRNGVHVLRITCDDAWPGIADECAEFTNYSADIRQICTDALDLLGIAWRPNGTFRISVARREAVAALDEHVGPKH